MKVKTWPIVAIAVVVFSLAWALSPFMTVWQVKRAIDSRDAIALADHVDFPALRDSVKGHMAPLIAKISTPKTGESGFASALSVGLGAMMSGMMNTYIDSFLTPEGLRAAMAESPEKKQKRELKLLDRVFEPRAVTRWSYETPNRFTVGISEAENQPNAVVYVFTRSSLLDWKLSSLRLRALE